MSGTGPTVPDGPTRAALGGSLGRGTTPDAVIAAVPVFEGGAVDFVVRVAEPPGAIDGAVWAAILTVVLTGGVAVLAAVLVARALVRRLVAPIDLLTAAVRRLGAGDFSVRTQPTGIVELDDAGAAVNASAERLGDLIDRERSFTADASHQLRTPLTGMRLEVELALAQPGHTDDAVLGALLRQIDSLTDTVDHLLALARDLPGETGRSVDAAALVREMADAWRARIVQAGRRLDLACEADLPPAGMSEIAARQVLDVLIANAVTHGAGTIGVHARSIGDVVIVEVSDEGPGVAGSPEAVFTRRAESASGNGIGLSLARSLAGAESARLLLRAAGPHPVFALVMPSATPASEAAAVSDDAGGVAAATPR